MSHVVADCSHRQGESLVCAKVVLSTTIPQNVGCREGDVHCMNPIVEETRLSMSRIGGRPVEQAAIVEERTALAGPLVASRAVVQYEASENQLVACRLPELGHIQLPRVEHLRRDANLVEPPHRRLCAALLPVRHLADAAGYLTAAARGALGRDVAPRAVALKHRPVALVEFCELLRIQRGGLHRDLAEHCDLRQHLFQQFRLCAHRVTGLLMLLLWLVLVLLSRQIGHRVENLGCDPLHIVK
mmetsp:Transcript_44306/g.117250  ORF Transcript_44306/g.117250 Transcript_44306/m.117250 type:complete len:243 (-) Transcript_44306:191-919(-)